MEDYGEYENFPVNDRFELMEIVRQEAPNRKVTWSREYISDGRSEQLDVGELLSFKFNVAFDNAYGVTQKVKFDVINYQGLKKKEFRRIVKGVVDFLNTVKHPLEVEVKVGVGGLVGAKNRKVIISVNNTTGGVKQLFAIGEFIKFKPYNPIPKYILVVRRNPKAFGITRVTPEKVKAIGMNPSEIFNSDGYPVNLELYKEAVEKLTNQQQFTALVSMFENFIKSLNKHKSLFIFSEPEYVVGAICQQSLSDEQCTEEKFMRECANKVIGTIKGAFKEAIGFVQSKEYWKAYSQTIYPYCNEMEKNGVTVKFVDIRYIPDIL